MTLFDLTIYTETDPIGDIEKSIKDESWDDYNYESDILHTLPFQGELVQQQPRALPASGERREECARVDICLTDLDEV